MGNKQQIVRGQEQSKKFDYSKGDGKGFVTLNFSLRTDMKTQLANFKELLEAALEDVNKELESFK